MPGKASVDARRSKSSSLLASDHEVSEGLALIKFSFIGDLGHLVGACEFPVCMEGLPELCEQFVVEFVALHAVSDGGYKIISACVHGGKASPSRW